VPTLRLYEFGSDLGVNEGSYDFAVFAGFDDMDGYLAYRDNPEHRAIIRDHITPIIGNPGRRAVRGPLAAAGRG
jgi:Stress responsive A/B Barrel Domain